jgi:hypothetical protein
MTDAHNNFQKTLEKNYYYYYFLKIKNIILIYFLMKNRHLGVSKIPKTK